MPWGTTTRRPPGTSRSSSGATRAAWSRRRFAVVASRCGVDARVQGVELLAQTQEAHVAEVAAALARRGAGAQARREHVHQSARPRALAVLERLARAAGVDERLDGLAVEVGPRREEADHE